MAKLTELTQKQEETQGMIQQVNDHFVLVRQKFEAILV